MLNFSDILGQSHAVSIIQSALQSEHIHHAWIFHGSIGIGKFTVAKALAAALLEPDASLNLTGIIEADPDGRCVHLIEYGAHPDYHVIRKELATVSRKDSVRRAKQVNIPKEVVLEFLIEPAAHTGHGDQNHSALASKVLIIDEAELLAREGQNLLLKTLEEPPPGTVIILVTSQLDKLLPTIRSRCQRIGFSPLSDDEMSRWLARFINNPSQTQSAEDVESLRPISNDERTWLLRFAAGSPGLAEVAIRNHFFNWYDEIAPRLRAIWNGQFDEMLGKRLKVLVDDYAVESIKGNPNASKGAANKAGARFMFQLIAAEMRGALRMIIAKGGSPDRILHLIELLQSAEQQLNSNVNMEMLFENLIIQWDAGRNESSIWFATTGT